MVHSNSDWTDCRYADIAVVENVCGPGKWLLKVRCMSCPDVNGCAVADIVDDWFCVSAVPPPSLKSKTMEPAWLPVVEGIVDGVGSSWQV